jgi:hypothetical protein
MSYRERVESLRDLRWSIPLATHFGTDIVNETSIHELKLSLDRQETESSFERRWKRVREPIAGYNCFGQVFANRRTAIYDDENVGLIELILAEDGFRRIPDEEEFDCGDVVLYYDDLGAVHAGRIVRFAKIERVISFDGAAPQRDIPVVLSKFDDVSGEYEHPIASTMWTSVDIRSHAVFRDRGQQPAEPTGWRQRLVTLDRR